MYEDIVLGFEFELEGSDAVIYDFIENTSDITGYTERRIYMYHGTRNRTLCGKWRVESDTTIDGAEFISPPEKYEKAKPMVHDFFSAIKDYKKIKTTSNCGLHVGMSINGRIDDIDINGFLCGLNMQLMVALCPGRIGKKCNGYCRGIDRKLFNLQTKDYRTVGKDIFRSGCGFVSIKKFNGIPYIELRSFGGKNYHERFDALFELIDHVAYNMLNSKKQPRDKVTKKMISYINRAEVIKREKFINNKYIISNMIDDIYYYERNNRHIPCKPGLQKIINGSYSMYDIIKAFTANNKKGSLNSFKKAFTILNRNDAKIKMPETESGVNKVKILKYWKMLPLNFVVDLVLSLSEREYSYFVKYGVGLQDTDVTRDCLLKKISNETYKKECNTAKA